MSSTQFADIFYRIALLDQEPHEMSTIGHFDQNNITCGTHVSICLSLLPCYEQNVVIFCGSFPNNTMFMRYKPVKQSDVL